MSASASEFIDFIYLSPRGPNVYNSSFRSFAFKGATMRANFRTTHRNALHNLKKDESFVRLVKVCDLMMTFVICAIPRRGGLIVCPK